MEQDRASWLKAPMGIFLAWSASAFLIRAWAKFRTKTWGLDDYFLSLSLLLYTSELLYVLAQGSCRASAALFISHMAQCGPQSLPAKTLATISGVWTAASSVSMALRGDVSRPWSTLDGTRPLVFDAPGARWRDERMLTWPITQFIRWISIEIIGAVIELAIWVLAVHLVWTLQMTLRKRIYILSAFSVKLVSVHIVQAFARVSNIFHRLVVLIGLRLKYLSPSRNWDPTLTSIMPGIFTQAVLHFSIIASCVTTLKPFLRHFDPTYVLESADLSSSKRSRASINASRDPYYRLGAINRLNRTGHDPNDKVNWRPYQGPKQADLYSAAYHDSSATQSSQSSREGRLLRASRSIGANLRGVAPSRQDGAMQSKNEVDVASLRTDASDRMIIQRKTEVSVKHEVTTPQCTIRTN
ncbi:hypothetical protein MY1884_001126 [Beauveria asiatica]